MKIKIVPLIIILVGIVTIVVIWRNRHLLTFPSYTPISTVAPVAAAPDQIYPSAEPLHECDNISDGEIEQDGDRREPQIACGHNFLNTEATAYINYSGVSDTLSIKLRGPKHSGIPDSDMCNDIHYFNLGSNNTAAFGKQAGHTAEYCEFGSALESLPENTWVGVKAIEWNEGSGVHFQSWIENPAGSGFKLVADEVDNGGAGSCQGPAREAYTTSPCQDVGHPVSIGFRVDGLSGGGNVQFGNLSVREIAPPAAALTTTTAKGPATITASVGGDGDSSNEEDTEAGAARSRRRRRGNIAQIFRVSNIR